MTVTITRGRRLLIAWALFIQAVLLILGGLQLAEIHGEIGTHSKELATISRDGAEVASLVRLIDRALSTSKHPSEVDQSVLFQLCRATPGCRIP